MRLITLKLFVTLLLAAGFSAVFLGLQVVSPPISRAFNFTVTKFTDTNDSSCDADCSLREAIIGANASVTDDTITLGAGIYTLSITGTGENLAATGDLDVDSNQVLTITGLGPAQTIIDANSIDRVFHILNGTVVISGVTVRGGSITGYSNADGGGILNESRLHLQNSVVTGNRADDQGGGIANMGTLFDTSILTITQSSIYSNYAKHEGGGISNYSGILTVAQSDIYSNTADNRGAGLYNLSGIQLGIVTITQSSVYNNSANSGGGGIYNHSGSMTITESNIYNNSAHGGGGIWNYEVLTLTESSVYSNTANGNGGGIYNVYDRLVVNQSGIYSNSAGGGGGGIYNDLAVVIMAGSAIYGNSAANTFNGGGGIYSHSSVVTLTGSSIYSNNTKYLGPGGGIHHAFGDLTITDSSIYGNSASGSGGGVSCNGSTPTIIRSSICNNSANYGGGGGIGTNSDSLTIIQSNICGNTATGNGGGIRSTLDALTVTQSSIYGNTATGSGGGIYAPGTLSLENSTVSSNQAIQGGGISSLAGFYSSVNDINLLNSTVASNHGGGLYAVTAVTATLQNTLFASNTGGNCDSEDALISFGHNLADDNTCNLITIGDQPNTDPLLQPLADNGGVTVGVDNAPLLTHAIPPGSLAVDAADNTACPATDQRGIVRPQGPNCDIGAFEVAPGPALSIRKTAPTTVTPGDTITYTLTVTNSGTISAATNVFISDTLPSGANLVSVLDGGILNGDVIQWTTSSLNPGNAFVARFVVTATENIINEIYLATADENISASGGVAVVTIVGEAYNTYLPIIVKGN